MFHHHHHHHHHQPFSILLQIASSSTANEGISFEHSTTVVSPIPMCWHSFLLFLSCFKLNKPASLTEIQWNSRDECVIRKIAVRSPTSTCKEICSALLNKSTDISQMTISRHLGKESSIKSHKSSPKNNSNPNNEVQASRLREETGH